MPSWAPFVKTGMHKERPPTNSDWWYIRAASVLRKVHLLGPIGVSKLRTKYGGKKNRGVKPGKFYKSSGNIIRKILQQLEEAKLIKQDIADKHKGRVTTSKGISLLFSTAKKIEKPNPKNKTIPKVKEETNSIEKAKTKDKTIEKKEETPKEETKEKIEAKTKKEEKTSKK